MNTPQKHPETTEKADPANAVSVAQLCALNGCSPALISALKDILPAPFTVPAGGPKGGKPLHMFPLEQLAEFILDRTDFLTDAECRLRVALSAHLRKRKSPMARFIDDHSALEIDGALRVLPRDHSALTPELRTQVEALIKQQQADLGARRSARRQIRSHITPEPEVTQP